MLERYVNPESPHLARRLGEDPAQYPTRGEEVGSTSFRLPPSSLGDIPSTSDRPTTCARRSRSLTDQAAARKTSLLGTTAPRVPVTGLTASIHRAREGARAEAEEGIKDETRRLRHRLGTSDNTVRKHAFLDWPWAYIHTHHRQQLGHPL